MTIKELINFYKEFYAGGWKEFIKICKDKRRLGFYLVFCSIIFMLLNLLFLKPLNAIVYSIVFILGGYIFQKGGFGEDCGATLILLGLLLTLTKLFILEPITGSYSLIMFSIGFFMFVRSTKKKEEKEKTDERI